MLDPLLPVTFDRAKLSRRENEILGLAVEGLTDFQIATRLSISPSTVNSYWVRIRGKVGHLSRTEFVAAAVKAQASEQISELLKRSQEFERKVDEREQIDSDVHFGEFYRMALDSVPEPLFVIDEKCVLTYTNDRLDAMFGYRPKELIGSDLKVLMPTRFHEAQYTEIEGCIREPGPLRIGIDKVVYGRRKNGAEMRIILLLDGKSTKSGVLITGLVRNFIEEVDVRRRSLAAFSSTIT